MAFLAPAGKLLGGVLGLGLGGLFGRKKRPALPKPATRDDAANEAAREQDLARRRGASADRIVGSVGGASSAGGIGRLIPGS